MKKIFLLLLSVLFVVSCSKDPIIYTLTTSANPSDGGTVSPVTKQYNEGETATINSYSDKEFSYALIENIGTVEFNIRVESIDKEIREFIIKPYDKVVVKLYRAEILYLDSLTLDKAEAKIMYTINENELPPPPPPVE